MKKHYILYFCLLLSYGLNAQISGTVFRDFNNSGIKENTATFNEPFVSGTTVKATLANGTSFTTTTDANGAYSFSAAQIPSGTSVRIEFIDPTGSSIQGTSNGTNVQFSTGGTSNVNYAVNSPDDYWNNTGNAIPTLMVVHQNRGTSTNTFSAGKKALLQTTNAASGPNNPATSDAMSIDTSKRPALFNEVGSTFSLAYQLKQQRFFQTAFMKRMSGFGPKGLGGVYIMTKVGADWDNTASFDLNGVTPSNGGGVLDFGSVTRTTTPGTNAATANYISINDQWSLSSGTGSDGRDNDAFFKVGTMSIGGAEVDRCEDTLFLINIFQNKLLTVDVSGSTASLNNATAAVLGPLTKSYTLSSISGYPTAVGAGNNIRPFGIKFYRGKGYLGVVSDAMATQNAADLKGYILQFDPHNISAGFTNILTINFNLYSNSFWHPWISTWAQTGGSNSSGPSQWPQPMITDIEFNEDGSMDIGIRDRWGDQGGSFEFWPVATPSTTAAHDQTNAQGDLLHVCNVGGTWVIEGTAGSCTQLLSNGSSASNNVGDQSSYNNTGKEYYGDRAGDGNPEDEFGGLAKLMGSRTIVSTCLDPMIDGASNGSNYWSTSGVKWNNNISGIKTQVARCLGGNFNNLDKANSLGDLEFVQECPKIQIGNRLWVDANSDGIQDAGEAPIPSATVELVGPGPDNTFGTIDDEVLATTTTGPDGSYYFSTLTTADTRKPSTWTGIGTNDILPDNNYQVRVPLNQSALTTSNYSPVTSNANSNANDNIDSDGDPVTIGAATYSAITFNTKITNHNFDFGFAPSCAKPDAGIDQVTTTGSTVTLTGSSPATGTWTAWTGNPTGATLGATTAGVASATFGTNTGFYRFIYADGSCEDTMQVEVINCNFTPSIVSSSCHSNGTDNVTTDDYITFTLKPSADSAMSGRKYSVTATQGGNPIGVTLSDGTAASGIYFGYDNPFKTATGTAGQGNITLTITASNGCTTTQTLTLTDPGTCNTVTPACSTGTVTYTYRTPFQTTDLNMVPLDLPKFDEQGGARTLTGVSLNYTIGYGTNIVSENSAANPQTATIKSVGDGLIDFGASNLLSATFPQVSTGLQSYPAGVTVAAGTNGSTWPGDSIISGLPKTLPRSGQLGLSDYLQSIYVDPSKSNAWVSNYTGLATTDDDLKFTVGSASANGTTTYNTAPTLAPFIGTGLVSGLSATTLMGISITGGGGNILVQQATKAYAEITVTYSYSTPCTPSISLVTAAASACNGSTNQYDVTGTVTFTNPPTTGVLKVSVLGEGYQNLYPPFTSPANYTIAGLNADGQAKTVVATFSSDTTATNTASYTAPTMCIPDPCGATGTMGVETYTSSIPLQSTNWTLPLTIPQFNTQGGTHILSKVLVSVKQSIRNVGVVESLDADTSTVNLMTTGTTRFKLNTDTIITNVLVAENVAQFVQAGITVPAQGSWPGDLLGSTELAMATMINNALNNGLDPRLDPTWVTTATGNPATDDDIAVFGPRISEFTNNYVFTSPTDLAKFMGTGNLDLTANAKGATSIDGPGNTNSTIKTKASTDVTVIYVYCQPNCIPPLAGADMTACGATCVNITGTSPTTGTWSEQTGNPSGATLGTTAAGIAEVCFAATASGTYNFIYSISSGCEDTMSIVVTPKPDAGPDQTTCFMNGNGTATLAATGTGTWTEQAGNPGTSTIVSSTANNTNVTTFSATGTYNYIWTNGACSDTVSVVVNPNGNIGNYVWNDLNGNGTNDEAASAGINGVTVELWKETAPASGTYALSTSTTTANDGTGNPGYYNFIICESANYQVKFPTTEGGNNLTTQTSTAATDGNSDANPLDGLSPVIAMDVNGTGTAKENPTIDAAYYSAPICSLSTVPLLTMSGLSFGSGSAPLSEDVTTNGSFILSENNIAGFNVGTSSEGPFFTFCTEINQPLLPLQNPYTHELNGTANGFSASQAYRIAQVIQASGFNNATGFGAGNNTTVNMVALQFAIWNSLYDTDYSVTAGNFQSFTDNNGARTLANTWLSAAQNINTPSIVVHRLHNPSGQDLFMIGDVPPITVNPVSPTCTGTNAPDNGGLTISGFTTGQRYQYSTGTSFASGSAIPASITTIPVGGNIVSSLSNTNDSYTIRIYDATDDNCFIDRTVSIVSILCCTTHNAGPDQTICYMNGNGTATLAATGTGTWTEQAGNPGTSTIVSSTANNTVVNNFSATGTYHYIWTNGSCTDTVSVLVTPNGSVGNYVWNDVNRDGINNEAASAGLNGVTVELWKETAPGSGVYAFDATTTTANDGTGNPGYYNFIICDNANYEVQFPTTIGAKSLTSQTTTAATDNNSDANTIDGLSPAFAIDVNGTGVAKDNNTIDAGYYQTAQLGNYVWNDLNHDGIQNNNEVGVAGVTISLVNSSNTILATTVTDAYGYYLFKPLDPETYYVIFSLPANYVFTTANAGADDATDSDPSEITGMTGPYTIVSGDSNMTVDAGIYQPQPITATVGDKVWFDANSNGIQDPGEQGVSGVTVTLCSNAGTPIATTITDANGNYIFENVIPGTYSVGFSLPIGTTFTTQSGTVSGTDNSDANTATGKTSTFPVNAGDHITYVDAGIIPQLNTKASLGDKVWNDANQDGIQDPTETGVPGVTVTLYGADGTTVIKTTTTDGLGNYNFTNLTPGCYEVGFSNIPSGYVLTAQNAGTDTTKNSNANTSTGMTDLVCLTAGQNNPTIDAGIYNTANTNSIGDKVWYDANKNGLQDPTEYGYPGVVVTLCDNNGAAIANTVTDANGNYLFDGLPNGTYAVGFGFVPGYQFTSANADAAGILGASNSDANPSNGKTGQVSLTGNTHITTVDAGIYPGDNRTATSSLGDLVWQDMNQNGLQDAGETGVPGVTVTLYQADGTTPIATTITDGLGNYIFTNLSGGQYIVGFSNIPVGYTLTSQSGVVDDATNSDANTTTGKTGLITLGLGEDKMTVDAGIYPPSGTASLGNYVWIDLNNDGLQDANEPPVPGVTVKLYDATNNVINVATTNTDGMYLFSGLTPGSYYVGFENLPSGYVYTPQSGVVNDVTNSDANPANGKTDPVTLASGDQNLNLDGGINSPTTAVVGNYVWYDLDADGIQDPNESPIPGVLVTLYDNTNTPVTSAVTDAEGKYLFTNVLPGTYTIGFEGYPEGLVATTKGANPAADDDSNIDPVTGKTNPFTVTPGSSNLTLDAGFKANPIAGLGNYVWNDVNHNGLQDATEPGIAGVIVTLYLSDAMQMIGTAVTDGNGYYSFPNLSEGNYIVEFSQPVNLIPTTFNVDAAGINGPLNSDMNVVNFQTAVVSLTSGTYNPNVDAGFYLNLPVPVTMKDFNVVVNDCKSTLYWTTSSEQNTSRFDVKRKAANEPSFKTIASVAAAGNSHSEKRYSYQDLSVSEGSYDYKLQIVDIDSKSSETGIETAIIHCSGNNLIEVYPNPATESLNINIKSSLNDEYTILVRDFSGRVVMTTSTLLDNQSKVVRLNVAHLAQGVYSVQVSNSVETSMFKIEIAN